MRNSSRPGLLDFSWYKIPKREKYTKLPQTIPNVKNITIARPYKIFPNSHFLVFKNKPSGNPAPDVSLLKQLLAKKLLKL
jgi:hypothetical protein